MGFSDLKKNSKKSVQSLQKMLEDTENKKDYKDDRFWRPELDSSSNGYAVFRFLPACEGEDLPWAKYYSHAFQGRGGWFIENCLTTNGGKCPVCEINTELWNSGLEKDKDIARTRKRKLHYVSNILVVSDPANPSNEGKVFLFKYGKKIFDKIQAVMQPEFPDEQPVNPFDFWSGADFRLKVRKVAGYINYDKSEFSQPSPVLGGDDKKLETLWKTQYPLSEFTDAKNFKTYNELKTRLTEVLGGDIRSTEMENNATAEDVDFAPKARNPSPAKKTPRGDSGDEESALSYFERLANEDN